MSYKTLYRQWRPQKFQDIVGQDHIAVTLKNAFQNGKFAHAYLLAGPRGTGKTSTAKIIAKAANCLNLEKGEPCDGCTSCALVNNGNSFDINEIDGASNRGIDEIRDLREKVKLLPAEGRYKVYIIDEAHMLTGEAFNALLKTLEEPPAHVIFILATTEPHKMPATVLSRCQRFDFKRLTVEQMKSKMEEICAFSGVDYDQEALFSIARFADGAMRDSLSILDQCMSYGMGSLKMEDVHNTLGTVDFAFQENFIEDVIAEDIKGIINKIETLAASGKDVLQFSSQLMDYLHNLLLLKISDSSEFLVSHQVDVEKLKKQSEKFSREQIIQFVNMLADAGKEMKSSSNSRLIFELAVINYLQEEIRGREIAVLKERVSSLEAILNRQEIKDQESYQEFQPEEAVHEIPSTEEAGQEIPSKGGADHEISSAEEAVHEIPSTEESTHEVENENYPDPQETISFDKIKAGWNNFLKYVKKNKITIYAFLVETQPVELNEKCLVLGVPQGYTFHKDRLEQRENKEIVRKFLNDFFEKEFSIEVKIMEAEKKYSEAEEKESQKKETSSDSSEEYDIVKEAAYKFEGSIID